MPSSNRLQIASVVESTLGTTPGTPRMRLRHVTGESLNYRPTFVDPAELRSDRMTGDSIQVGTQNDGGITYEMTYPFPSSPKSSDIESAMYSTWSLMAERSNDGTADSVITDVATTNTVLTVSTGTAFVAGQLVRFTGFTVTGNNGVFKCTTGSATVPRFVGSGITDEAAPPAAARVKVVGFQGASGDITATATGLGSTALDFTTLGLTVGQPIKIGGSATADKFATAACNVWARITAISATALTLDNLPSTWTTDSGTSKTIKVWFGDPIKNGTTQLGQTIEKGFLGQGTPTYIVHTGMVVNTYEVTIPTQEKIMASVTYLGMGGSQSTTALDASPDAAPALATYPVFAGSVNVARLGEAGLALGSPNWARNLTISINNNNTPVLSNGDSAPVAITGHEMTVTGSISTYFGSNALLTKFYAGTPTTLFCVIAKAPQALVITVPRVIYNGNGSPNASSKNQDVMLDLAWRASKDETYTNALITMDRFEYYEA